MSSEEKEGLLTKDELIKRFGIEEYAVFSLMLGISALIGIIFAIKSCYQKSLDTKTILLGGGNMGLLPMTLSLVASFMSAITLLGTPAEMYVFGTQYIVLILSYPFVLASAAEWYLPVFWKLKVSTSYEYLEWRFNKVVRLMGSLGFVIQMTLYMAIVVLAPALALEQLTGLKADHAIPIIFAVCVFYTALGGMKAVMWTDSFQSLMMFGSFIAVIIKGNYDAGGAGEVFDRNYRTGRVNLFDFSFDMRERHTVWGLIVGGYFTWLSIYGVNQTQIQRYLSVSDIKKAKKAIYWNILGIGSLLLMCAYAGMVIFAFYDKYECDPLTAKLVDKKDQLFPLFVMQVMGDIPLIPGLFVAGVFSGALSTVSSGLNSLSAVVVKDLLHGGFNIRVSPKVGGALTIPISVFFGFLSYGLVFVVAALPGVLEAALSIFGFVGGPVLGVFTLGMFIPYANSTGAICGMISGLFLSTWICFGQIMAKSYKFFVPETLDVKIDGCPANWNVTFPPTELPPEDSSFNPLELYKVSYIWYGGIATMTCVIVGTIVSFCTKPQDLTTLNPRLLSPGLRGIFDWVCIPQIRRAWHDWFDAIGENFVMTQKEIELIKNQILVNEDTSDEESEGKDNHGYSHSKKDPHHNHHHHSSNGHKQYQHKTSL